MRRLARNCSSHTRTRCSSAAQVARGLPELEQRVEQELRHMLRPMELLVPYSQGSSLAELHDIAGDLRRQDTPEGVLVRHWCRHAWQSAMRALLSRSYQRSLGKLADWSPIHLQSVRMQRLQCAGRLEIPSIFIGTQGSEDVASRSPEGV